MERYIYPAVFEQREEGGYTVMFPDLPGCISEGDDADDALLMAKDALELYMYNVEDDKEEVPAPSSAAKIKLEKEGSFTSLVEAWMPPVRTEMENKAVKKTLTIPKWLNDAAEDRKVNFSQVLQVALKNHLGLSDKRL